MSCFFYEQRDFYVQHLSWPKGKSSKPVVTVIVNAVIFI